MMVLNSIFDKLIALKYNFLLFYLVDMVSYAENVKKLLEINRTSSGSPAAIKSLFKLTFKGRRLQITSGMLLSVKDILRSHCPVINQSIYAFIFLKTKFLFQELTPNILFSLVMYRIRFNFWTKNLQ